MQTVVFDRETLKVREGKMPSGTMGQISFKRLCNLFEEYGEVHSYERITHLEIDGDMIRYRVEHEKR